MKKQIFAFTLLVVLSSATVSHSQVTVGRYKLLSNVDFSNEFYITTLIASILNSEEVACMAACNQNTECRMTTFSGVSNTCYLFNQTGFTCGMNYSLTTSVYLRNKPSCGVGQTTDGWMCYGARSFSDYCDNATCSCNSSLGLSCINFTCINGTSRHYECGTSPCLNGGVCTDLYATYSCSCPAGFNGTNCENNINMCASNPCNAAGTYGCSNQINSYTCNCNNGYTGGLCDQIVDNCASQPCLNGRACTNQIGSYTCTCVAPYTGTTCTTLINYCSPNSCSNNATCTILAGSPYFNCTCLPGYNGTLCDTNYFQCPAIGNYPDTVKCYQYFLCTETNGVHLSFTNKKCQKVGPSQYVFDYITNTCKSPTTANTTIGCSQV